MARLGPAIHVLVVAQESTTVKLQSLTGIGLMGHIKAARRADNANLTNPTDGDVVR
jgi:hypothetical protein